MNVNQIDAQSVQLSFEILKPKARVVLADFCQSLFAICPEMRLLFEGADQEQQRSILILSFSKLISGLSQLSSLRLNLETLGTRLRVLGVKQEHFVMIQKALLSTFQIHLHEKWTSELEQHWKVALEWMIGQMIGQLVVPWIAPEVRRETKRDPSVGSKTVTESDLSVLVRQIARDLLMRAIQEEARHLKIDLEIEPAHEPMARKGIC